MTSGMARRSLEIIVIPREINHEETKNTKKEQNDSSCSSWLRGRFPLFRGVDSAKSLRAELAQVVVHVAIAQHAPILRRQFSERRMLRPISAAGALRNAVEQFFHRLALFFDSFRRT